MNFKFTLLHQVTASFLMHACNIVFILLSTAILARYQNPDVFGSYIMILAAVTVTSILVSFGLPTFLVREVSSYLIRDDIATAKAVFRFSFFLTCGLLVMVLTIFLIVDVFLDSSLVSQAGIGVAIFLTGKVFSELFSGALVGFNEIIKGQFIQFVIPSGSFLFVLIIICIVLQEHPTIREVFYIQAGSTTLAAALGAGWLVSVFRRKKTDPNTEIMWVKWLCESFPLTLINGLAAFNQNALYLVLGVLCTPESAGLYRIADRVGAFAQFLRGAVDKVIAPRVARYWAIDDKESISRIMGSICVLNVLFNGLYFLGSVLFGGKIIALMFGYGYVDAWIPLTLLTGGFFLASLFGFNGILLTMTAHAKVVSSVLIVSVIAQLGLTFPLTVYFDVTGAAVAASSVGVCTAFALWKFAKKTTGINCAVNSLFSKV